MKFNIGDVVKLKKTHPCGGDEWEIYRVGMDFGIKCLGCGRKVMIPRPKFEKSVKKIIKTTAEED
ncbi:MAG: hypothetical protein PWQ82_312 [Thermosediminibacterales bacterium]|nr:hypothetical protein [Thermosediminibacterales bacterium]MDK2836406.1 hypothetical protein [Thermosediminibacterales bacterium]